MAQLHYSNTLNILLKSTAEINLAWYKHALCHSKYKQ